MNVATRQQHFRACLLAGAVGDALGGTVEFMSLAAIRRSYGPLGIRDYPPAQGGLGLITDDTQMTLYTAAALLDAETRRAGAFLARDPLVGRELCSAYLHWLRSQGLPANGVLLDGRAAQLGRDARLNEQRAPGATCLSALLALRTLDATTAINDRKGCGGVMRVGPVGLMAAAAPDAPALAFYWGCLAAAITHGHPTGYLAAGATAVIIAMLAQGQSMAQAIAACRQQLMQHPGHAETLAALDRAVDRARLGRPQAHDIEALGGGWVAEETLAIAVYCALVAPSLEAGIVLAANHSGDSDSTAAVAGHFLGLLYGLEAIPPRWLETLECRDLIEAAADDLAAWAAQHSCDDQQE